MRSVSVALLLVVTAMAGAQKEKVKYDLENAPALFEQFIKDYDRQYKDDADKEVHFRAFVESLKKINELNTKDSTATYGINKFADYTEDEKKNLHGLRKPT